MKFYGFVRVGQTIHMADGAFDDVHAALERARSLTAASLPNARPNARGSIHGVQDVMDVLAEDCYLETGKRLRFVRGEVA